MFKLTELDDNNSTLSSVFSLINLHLFKLFIIAAIIVFVLRAPEIALRIKISSMGEGLRPIDEAMIFAADSLISLVATLIIIPLLYNSLIGATAEHYLLRTISISRALRFSRRRFGNMLLTIFFFNLMTFGLYRAIFYFSFRLFGGVIVEYRWLVFVAVVFVASCVAANWAFAIQVVSLEGISAVKAFSRSRALVKNNYIKVLVVLFPLLLLSFVPFMILQDHAQVELHGLERTVVAMPVFVLGLTLLYFRLRTKKEGIDPGAIAQVIGVKTDLY